MVKPDEFDHSNVPEYFSQVISASAHNHAKWFYFYKHCLDNGTPKFNFRLISAEKTQGIINLLI